MGLLVTASGGNTLRKMTMGEIRSRIAAKGQLVDYSVNRFRGKTKEEGWVMKRTRPRNADEMKALNYLLRKSLRSAMEEGLIRYDKEGRVMNLAKYSRS
jgi:hypothetical protein